MPWIRCPYGCHHLYDDQAWVPYAPPSSLPLTCQVCHRSNPATAFQEVPESEAIAAVSGVRRPDRTRGQELLVSARKRITTTVGNLQWFGYNQEALVKQLHEKIVQMLINAELTSNFPTPRIWDMLSSGGQLKNMWARGEDLSKRYARDRNDTERSFFQPLSDKVSADPSGSGRPYYIAVNLNRLQQGAAPYYGRSYVVYKDAVKTRCTFTATDTMQLLKQRQGKVGLEDVCDMATIANVLNGVSDRQLSYLCSLAGGPPMDSPNEFIEAQAWGPISLTQDVAIIVIAESDLQDIERSHQQNADLMPPHLAKLTPEARRADIAQMKSRLKDFCTRHGISLTYLPLGPETMNSREPRPA